MMTTVLPCLPGIAVEIDADTSLEEVAAQERDHPVAKGPYPKPLVAVVLMHTAAPALATLPPQPHKLEDCIRHTNQTLTSGHSAWSAKGLQQSESFITSWGLVA
mmetsp:Transcript_24297/g.44608  ORF Transcript_24297/g.44608 Transcript_24297/m.44608 type:complete len:104 (+) Transcript_24297:265-576(+)